MGSAEKRPLAQRLTWFVAFWALGVATVALLAYVIRIAMGM